jgi:hypothetical protein
MSIKRLALSLGLTLGLGYAFTPLGCGGVMPAAEVPEDVARLLRGCALDHRKHLGSVRHSVSFEVKFDSDGEVDSVVLRESTLGDELLELCMASALRSLSEDDLPLRRSEDRPRGSGAPESRAFLGQEEVLAACLASPPCLLTLAILMGAAYVTVNLYVHASSKPQPLPATPHVEESQKKDPKPEGDPKTTGTTPPIPPEPPKPKPTCKDVFPQFVNCSYIQQEKYPTRKAALEAALRRLPRDRQKRPFTTRGKEKSNKLPLPGVDHTTYYSADDRTKISIGCYDTCCKNTADGPVIDVGMKCYELNTEDLR